MKNIYYLLFFYLLMSFPKLFAQSAGLNCELGFNDTHQQSVGALCVWGEFTYLTHSQIGDEQGWYYVLRKVDTLGNVIWTTSVLPGLANSVDNAEIAVTDNGDVYCSGFTFQGTDVLDIKKFFIVKISSSGDILWSYLSDYDYTDYLQSGGLRLDNSGNVMINVSYSNNMISSESTIFNVTSDGVLLDSLQIPLPYLKPLGTFSGFSKIGATNQTLYGINSSGTLTDSLSFSAPVQSFETLQDTLFVLTTDSVYKVSPTFQVLERAAINGYTDYGNLKVEADKIEFISLSSSLICIHTMSHAFQYLHTDTITSTPDTKFRLNYNDEHVSIASDFDLSLYTSIRYQDFSRTSSESQIVHTTDIGVVAINFTDSTIVYDSQIYCTINISADVLVQNFGNDTLQSCRLNCLKKIQFYTPDDFYYQYFTDLNLPPGGTVWLSLGEVRNEAVYIGQGSPGVISSNVCIYTSHPNNVTDLNVSNDQSCRHLMAGYVGMETHTPPSNVTLRKIIDITGRETTFRPNTPLIYIYSDGSVKRVYRME